MHRFFITGLLLLFTPNGYLRAQLVHAHQGVERAILDSAVRPGNDFYQFANGRWLGQTKLAPTQSFYMPLIGQYEANTAFIARLVREMAATPQPSGSAAQRIVDYFASGLDTNRIEALNSQPLRPFIAWIDRIRTSAELWDVLAQLIRVPTNQVLVLNALPDPGNAQQYIATLNQGGLNLPRHQYIDSSATAKAIRQQYRTYLASLFQKIGQSRPQAEQQAQQILTLEQQLAQLHTTPETDRQAKNSYNVLSIEQLIHLTPDLNWSRLFSMTALKPHRINVKHPTYYQGLSRLLGQVPLKTWQAKLKADYVMAHVSQLSHAFYDPHADLFQRHLSGQRQPIPRTDELINQLTYRFKDALGQVYVERAFADSTKRRVLTMFQAIQTVFAGRIRGANWLSGATRQAALQKLAQMLPKIGYPDTWDQYTTVTIRRDDYFGNVERLRAWGLQKNLALIDQPVDRHQWRFTAFGTGASYNSSENSITLAAGYLQPPTYQAQADDAVQYGTLGTTLAHEMAHGFDDQGRQYDAQGNLRSWWSSADSAAFVGRCAPLIAQFNHYTVLDSLPVNGRLTLGENLADLVGLTVAYEAFTQTAQFKANQPIDGLSPAQRFFLSFAQERRSLYSEPALRDQLKRVWPPERFRVNGPLSNFTPFYQAFHVKPGDWLYKPLHERIVIW